MLDATALAPSGPAHPALPLRVIGASGSTMLLRLAARPMAPEFEGSFTGADGSAELCSRNLGLHGGGDASGPPMIPAPTPTLNSTHQRVVMTL